MDEQAKVRVWLKAITYFGDNIGSDTEFDVTVNGETVRIRNALKAGTTKVFDKLLVTQPVRDNTAQITLAVKVTEEDLVVDDVGQNAMELAVTKGLPRHTLPSLSVTVRENRGVLGTGGAATFLFQFEVEFLATGTVTACWWNGSSDKTRTLASYYSQAERYRRMADYLAGACAYFNLQAALGHALAAIEDGVSKPLRWVENRPPSANWMQLSPPIIKSFLRDYWRMNNATGLPDPEPDDVFRLDVLNAAAGIWYLCSLSPGNFSDEGLSYKTAMFKAMQYNWGAEYAWPAEKAACKPENWGDTFKPSAYPWTMAFLAWGNGYAGPDTRYTSEYAQYARTPVAGGHEWVDQDKRLSPLLAAGNQDAELAIPDFLVNHARRVTPYGHRSQSQPPPGSMKQKNARKSVCVIPLGTEAKNDVSKVFPDAHAYSSFQAWLEGTDEGYVDGAVSTRYQDNYRKVLEEALAAYRAGY